MPWRETSVMLERVLFIDALESQLYTMTELCERHGISRKTGYKWASRYVEDGFEGLADRSRAPKHCPHRVEDTVSSKLLELRRRRPRWGPRKLLVYLREREPGVAWPAASTVGELLRREGLISSRRRRRRPSPPFGRQEVPEVTGPNEVWTIDFKGQFRMGDRRYCYPLTVADRYSRYVLECRGLHSTAGAETRGVMERLFRRYGLPSVLLSDNGEPFSSSQALCGLSRLSVWWIKLGIAPRLIEPGHPEQNGSHERMHRTLKAETTRPPAGHLTAQQRRFNAFRRDFNEERPHEALGQRPPATLYTPSPRPYPERLSEMEYLGHFETRRVRRDGAIRWQGKPLFLSEVLGGERVGLEEIDDGIWSLYFGNHLLGRFDESDRDIRG